MAQEDKLNLPSDLDEAAEKYASVYPAYNNEQDIVKYAFKRGAEWMAKQGYQTECSIDYYDGPFLDMNNEQMFDLIHVYPVGTRVIVQIRKK